MKKIFLSIILATIFFATIAQTPKYKKITQYSIRGGLDLGTKHNATYLKVPMKGFDAGFSFDKYWNSIGLGVDVDFIQNNKPVYNDQELASYLLTPAGYGTSGGWYNAPFITSIQTNATKLNRAFIGIGPSFKTQSKNNKLQAELNLRGGITYTNGSAINFSTLSSFWSGTFFYKKDGSSSANPYIYNHLGYNKELLATAKAQIRVSYFVKPKVGINLGSYYMHYWGSDAKYDYLSFTAPYVSPKSSPSYGSLPVNQALTSLSSLGFTAGVSYRIGSNTNATTKKAANNITVNVKDELTGQPLSGVEVTIINANGKTYNATSNTMGLANFVKVDDGNYKINGLLNNIATNEQNAMLNSSNRNANATLIHNDPRFTVVGKAINLNTNKPESGVSVSLKNNDKGSIKMSTSQSGTGSFNFQIDANSDYELVGKKASYMSNIEKVSTKGLTRSQTLYVELEIGVLEVEKGKAIQLQKIYYDLDKSNIREEASSDLEKLVIFLQDNPNFKVEIASHTDNRGSNEYNQKLSQDRAQAVVNYLSQKGIATSRLVAKGYGETKLVNSCTTCTEEEHQQNRRTEFTVINQ